MRIADSVEYTWWMIFVGVAFIAGGILLLRATSEPPTRPWWPRRAWAAIVRRWREDRRRRRIHGRHWAVTPRELARVNHDPDLAEALPVLLDGWLKTAQGR